MTSARDVKAVRPIILDPNFFLPPNVVDMRYKNLEDADDSATGRDESGEVVSIDYDEISFAEMQPLDEPDVGNSSVSSVLSPPDYMTVVSQQVRVTADGKFVVDVILEVEDVPGVINFEARLSKP